MEGKFRRRVDVSNRICCPTSDYWLLACYDKTSNVRHWCMTPRHWGWKEAHEVDSMCIISILAQGNAKFKIKILHYPYILSGLWRSNVKNFMSYFQNVARFCPHPDGEPTILHVPQLANRVRRGHPFVPYSQAPLHHTIISDFYIRCTRFS